MPRLSMVVFMVVAFTTFVVSLIAISFSAYNFGKILNRVDASTTIANTTNSSTPGIPGAPGPTGETGVTGPPGPPGPLSNQTVLTALLRPRDGWTENGTWMKYDWVVYQGSSYVAKENISDPQSVPPYDSRWMLFASAGSRGANWAGQYATGRNYSYGNVVLYNGSSYAALQDNVATVPTDTLDWQPVALQGTDGQNGLGLNWLVDFDPFTSYQKNDLVSYQGSVYIALATTTGGDPVNNTAGWSLFVPKGDQGDPGPPGIVNQGNYTASSTYVLGDVVYLDGSSYQAINGTVPINTPPPNSVYWQLLVLAGKDGQSWTYRLDYDANTLYSPRDVVLFNKTLFVAQVSTTGDTPSLSSTYPWELFLPAGEKGDTGEDGKGLLWKKSYNASTTYALNDIVYYDGQSYIALASSTGVLPPINSLYWDLIVKAGADGNTGPAGTSFVWKYVWNSTITYYFNQVVNYNNVLYIALATNLNAQPDTHPTSWQLFMDKPADGTDAPIPDYVMDWSSGTAYAAWTVVLYNYSSYLTVTPTTGDEIPSNGAPWIPIAIGVQGAQGPAGVGTQGPKGDPGQSFIFLGNYSLTTNYVPGDAVRYEDELWGALTSNIGVPPDSSPTDWDVMLPKAKDGAGLVAKGDWMDNVTYEALNVVTLNGSSYIAMSSNIGQQPDISPNYWQVNALKGVVTLGGNGSNGLSLQGTENQVILTSVGESFTFKLTQDYSPTANPTLAGLTLTTTPLAIGGGGTNNKNPLVGYQMMCSTASKIAECGSLSLGYFFVGRGSAQLPVAGSILGSPTTGVNVNFTSNNFQVYLSQSLTTSSSPTFVTATFTGGLSPQNGGTGSQATLVGFRPLVSNAAGAMVEGPALPTGYLLIGKGATQDPVAGTLKNLDGTIVISMSGNDLVASLKQGVATTDTPTFAGIILTSALSPYYGGTGSAAGLVGNRLIVSTTTNKMVEAAQLEVGYFYTGNGSNPLIASTILSSDATVSISQTSDGDFDIRLDQGLSTSDFPTFAGIDLTSTALSPQSGGTGNSLTLVGHRIMISTTTGIIEGPSLNSGQFLVSVGGTSAPVAGSIVAGTNVNVAFSAGTFTISSSSTASFTTLTVTGTPISQSSGGTGTATCGASGTLLSATGSCGGQWITLQGTTNQLTFTTSGTTITGALPQDIAITSTPTFGGITLGPQTGGTLPIYYSPNQIRGLDSSLTAGPSIDFSVNNNAYPIFQIYPYTASNIKLIFGGALTSNGQYRSSASDGTVVLAKSNGNVYISSYVAPAGTLSQPTWTNSLGINCASGLTTIGAGLTVSAGATTLSGGLSVSGGITTLSNGLSVSGAMTTLNAGLTVGGARSIFGYGVDIYGGGTATTAYTNSHVLTIAGGTTPGSAWPAIGLYTTGSRLSNVVIASAASNNNFICFDCDYITGSGFVNTYTGSPASAFNIYKNQDTLKIQYATTSATAPASITMNTALTMDDTGATTFTNPATFTGGIYLQTSGATPAALNYYAQDTVKCVGAGFSTDVYISLLGTIATFAWTESSIPFTASNAGSFTNWKCTFGSTSPLFTSAGNTPGGTGFGGGAVIELSNPNQFNWPATMQIIEISQSTYQVTLSIWLPPTTAANGFATSTLIPGAFSWDTRSDTVY